MKRSPNKQHVLLICAVLALATAGVYWQVGGHEFVTFDDLDYVVENAQVLKGLTWEGFVWAFTTNKTSNWHPLTWFSLMLDCELFGAKPAPYHIINVLFHIANTLLLFLLLVRMTGAVWRSGLVAALFALHPLHVESVAWVSERKDVLSTFFWLVTMWAYVRYAERPHFAGYVLILLFFGLGLIAKPMLVTLPFVLLLVDYWPLGRFRLKGSAVRLVAEKVPLLVLATASCVMTYLAQKSGGSVWPMKTMGLNIRLANAVVCYVKYIFKTVWPVRLAVFYPHPGMRPMWQVAGAVLVLAVASAVVFLLWRRRPYLSVGWLWYLGTLVPVIGLVQVGEQSMADRYMYVPLIGLFIAVTWGITDLAGKWRYRRITLWVSAGVVLLALVLCTWRQVSYWQNSIKLFEHTLAVTSNNSRAHNVLGLAWSRRGEVDKAVEQYLEVLRLEPDNVSAHNNLGEVLAGRGEVDRAIRHHRETIRLKPDLAPAHVNLGMELMLKGQYAEGIKCCREALRLDPDNHIAHNNLGAAIMNLYSELAEAEGHFREAIRLKPDYNSALVNLATVLVRQGRAEEAIQHCREALRNNPNDSRALQGLKKALAELDKSSRQKDENEKSQVEVILPK